jgi:hypothetical protein
MNFSGRRSQVAEKMAIALSASIACLFNQLDAVLALMVEVRHKTSKARVAIPRIEFIHSF